MSSAMVLDALPATGGDVDIQMTMHTADPDSWESSMDADTDQPIADSESVEIDMEENYHDLHDAAEYEMAEDPTVEDSSYLDADVEFHDASAVPSPEAHVAIEEDSPVVDLTTSPLYEETSLPVYPEEAAATSLAPVAEPQTVEARDEESHNEPVAELHAEVAEHDLEPEDETRTEHVHESDLVHSTVHDEPEQPQTVGADVTESETLAAEVAVESTDEGSAPQFETHAFDLPKDASEQIQSEELADTGSAEKASELDPHEIDDGIYIDPPPPVHLDLPGDLSHVYIFNEPSKSGAGSPTPGSSRLTSEATIILQHLPTLYYEPLSSLFEALRTDDHLISLPQIDDSELLLEAYDLNLTVSEDNIHAREVSLHDLNIIHDGSSLSGPLRLRVVFSRPRFILRYRAMEEDINRLILQEPRQGEEPADFEEEHTNKESDPQTYNPQEGEDHHPVDDAQDDTSDARLEEVAGEEPEQEEDVEESAVQPLQAPNEHVLEQDTAIVDHGVVQEPSPDELDANYTEELDADAIHAVADTDAPVPVGEEATEFEEVYEQERAEEEDDAYEDEKLVENWDAQEARNIAPNLESDDVLENTGKTYVQHTAEHDSASTAALDADIPDTQQDLQTSPQLSHSEDSNVHQSYDDNEQGKKSTNELAHGEGETAVIDNDDASWANLAEAEVDGEYSTTAAHDSEEYRDGDAADLEQASAESSATLGSTSSASHKRSFDEYEEEDEEVNAAESSDLPEKRVRVA